MSDSSEVIGTVDLTPKAQHGILTPCAPTSHTGRTHRESYRVALSTSRGVGYIGLLDDGWHIYPDGAEEYPMRPDTKEDAAWLLLTFRNRITKRI